MFEGDFAEMWPTFFCLRDKWTRQECENGGPQISFWGDKIPENRTKLKISILSKNTSYCDTEKLLFNSSINKNEMTCT